MLYQELKIKMDKKEYKEIIKLMNEGKKIEGYKIKGEKLYKEDKEKLLRVLQKDEIESIMFMIHDHPTGGHFGIEPMYEKIKKRFYWKKMKRDIRKYVKTCIECQKRGNKGCKGKLNPIKINGIFERIGIDFVGPLPRTAKGNKYICVITEYLTKWPEAKEMKEATAENVVKFLYETIICRYGCPKIILSDRGTHFNNKLVDGLCQKFEIKHKLSLPYHPQTNGLVERFNRTLCEALAKLSQEENKWDNYIESVLFAYRTMKHGTTGKTPFYMMFGHEATLPIDEIEKDEEQNGLNEDMEILTRFYEIINIQEDRRETLDKIGQLQNKQKEKFDNKVKETIFKIADKVLLKDAAKEKQWSGKLQPKWKGPYYIHDILGKGTYKLRTMEGQVLKTPYNIKLLKGFNSRD